VYDFGVVVVVSDDVSCPAEVVWPGSSSCSLLAPEIEWEWTMSRLRVGNPVTLVPLASSDPHEDISTDVLGPQIVIWLMDILCHGSVLMKRVVDGRFAIRLGPIIRVVGDVGRHLALMGRSISPEDGVRLATM
jgi:hypothetical protein